VRQWDRSGSYAGPAVLGMVLAGLGGALLATVMVLLITAAAQADRADLERPAFTVSSVFFVVALMIETWGIVATYSLAALLAFAVNGISLTRILPTRMSNSD